MESPLAERASDEHRVSSTPSVAHVKRVAGAHLGQLYRAEHVRPALVSCRLDLERDPDPLQRHRQLLHHQLFLQPEHAVPSSVQRLIAARIRTLPPLVVAAIHLDNEPRLRREEVNDVARNWRLTPKLRTKASAAKGLPQTPL